MLECYASSESYNLFFVPRGTKEGRAGFKKSSRKRIDLIKEQKKKERKRERKKGKKKRIFLFDIAPTYLLSSISPSGISPMLSIQQLYSSAV